MVLDCLNKNDKMSQNQIYRHRMTIGHVVLQFNIWQNGKIG